MLKYLVFEEKPKIYQYVPKIKLNKDYFGLCDNNIKINMVYIRCIKNLEVLISQYEMRLRNISRLAPKKRKQNKRRIRLDYIVKHYFDY